MKTAVTTLVFCVAALLSLGMVMLYSASVAKNGAHYLVMQLVWGVLAAGACVTAACFDYRKLKDYAVPLYVVALVLLALVFVPKIGLEVKGARRWLDLGPFRYQPSEFAKIALIIGMAWYGDRYLRFMNTFWRGMIVPGAGAACVLALIFIEPDRGTTILLAGVTCVMLLICGVRLIHGFPCVLAAGCGLVWSLMNDTMRSNRIRSWLDMEGNRSDGAYQAYNAMLALGSGGWNGRGLGNGRQKLGFIPEHHTDFILSIIGEELGLIATLLVVIAFVLILVCGLYIASRAQDRFGMLVGSGISFLIGMQAFINIGVVTSALPNKGLSLPFISYGGSSLLTMLTCVGILLSIARFAKDRETVKSEASIGVGSLPTTQLA
jgi:cell division protein FtsW